MKKRKHLLCILLCLCMVVTLTPEAALASGGTESGIQTANGVEQHNHTSEDRKVLTMGTNYICIDGEQQTSNALGSGTYYLGDNVSLGYNTLTISAGATVILCLNGKTLSSAFGSYDNRGSVKVEANATLTVQDCGETVGVIQNTYSSGIGVYNAGTLTVSSGSIISGDYALYNDSGSMATIDGGSIISTGDSAVYNVGTLTVNGGEISCTYSYGGYAVENSGGTLNITGGTMSSVRKSAIYNENNAKLYVSGSPTLTSKEGEAQIYFYTNAPNLYPYTGNGESKTYYSGDPISIGLPGYAVGNPVVLEKGTVGAEKFTLMDSGYVLEQGIGDNEANLVIKAVERELTWQGKDGSALSGDGYPAKADHNSTITLPNLPAVDNLTAAGWLYSTDSGTSWSTGVWTTTQKVLADTTFKALYAPAFAGGNGSAETPYEIASFEQLSGLAMLVNADIGDYPTAYYKLTADINITGAWTPIGSNYTPFLGHFDGDGKTVTFGTGATLNAEYAGLFGAVGKKDTSATIENLLVTGSISNGNGGSVGVVAGALRNGSITGCAVTAEMTGVGDYIGGIVGDIDPRGACKVSRCYSTADVSGYYHVGGIAGRVTNYGTTFTVKIENCYSTGSVYATGSSSNAGGILGVFAGNSRPEGTGIFNCYATGNITHDVFNPDSAGGIVGNAVSGSKIENCLYLGIIVDGNSNSSTYVKRIAGNGTYAKISGCYGRSDTSLNYYASAEKSSGSSYVGVNLGNGATLTPGADDLTMESAFAAWDVEGSAWTIPTDTAFDVTKALPTLNNIPGVQSPKLPENKAPVPDYGNSTQDNADYIFPGRTYTIGSAEELSWLGSISGFKNCKDSFFELTADITATQAHYVVPIGSVNVPFCGSFDGKGHTVTPNEHIMFRRTDGSSYGSGDYYGGLFGYVGNENDAGTIKNVALGGPISFSDTFDTGKNIYLGGLVAFLNNGTLENCAASADVSFNRTNTGSASGICYVGGLVGNMGANGVVKNCYASGDVSATGNVTSCYVGGLVGQSAKTVENCYASGSVTGANSTGTYAGGLVGHYQNDTAYTKNSVALGASISKYGKGKAGRNVGFSSIDSIGEGNYARADMRLGSATTTGSLTDKNGAGAVVGTDGIAYSSLFTGWDSDDIWNITGETKLAVGASLPTLKVFGSKMKAPELIEYVGPGLNVEGGSFTSDYGATAAKSFNITLSGGLTGTPAVEWCSQDGSTTGTPAAAGNFSTVSGSEASYSFTLTPSNNANAGEYYFKVTVGDVSVVKNFTINKVGYSGEALTATVNVYAGGSGSITGAVFKDISGAKIKNIDTLETLNVLSADAALSNGTVSYNVKPEITSDAEDSYTVTLESTNYTDINATLVFAASAENRTLYFNGTTLKIGVTYNNLADYPADATWSIENKTLKLNDFEFTTSADTALYISSSCTVELTGANTITSTYSGSEGSYGIKVYASGGNIYFIGSGTLNATSGTSTVSSYGISAECYSLRFEGCTINAVGGSAPFSYGICAKSNMYVSEGARVTGKGTGSNYAYGIAQYTANLHVSGGTLIGEAGGTAEYQYGIAFSELYRYGNTALHLFGNSGSGYTETAKQSAEHNYNTSYTVVNAEGAETPFAKAKISTYTRDTVLKIDGDTATVDHTADEGWKWDKELNTLTLTNYEGKAINLPENAKLIINGQCGITDTATSISCSGDLNVSGDGSLIIKSDTRAISATNVNTGSATVIKKGAADGTGEDAGYDTAKYVKISFLPVVTFNTKGDSTVAPITAAGTAGNYTVTLPSKPTWGTYTFAGWFKSDGTQWASADETGSKKVTSSLTVYAKWTKDGKTVVTEPIDITALTTTTDKTAIEGWKWEKVNNYSYDASQPISYPWNCAGRLTLDGLHLDVTGSSSSQISGLTLPDGTVLVIIGTNTVTVSNHGANGAIGIFSEGPVAVSGSGALTVTATGLEGEDSQGVAMYTGGTLTIEDATLTLNGVGTNTSAGIMTVGGDVIINSGNISTTGSGYGIGTTAYNNPPVGGNLAINGGDVTAIGDTAAIYSQTGNITTADGATIIKNKDKDNTGDTAEEYNDAKYVSISFGPSFTVVGMASYTYSAADSLRNFTVTAINWGQPPKSITVKVKDGDIVKWSGAATLTGGIGTASVNVGKLPVKTSGSYTLEVTAINGDKTVTGTATFAITKATYEGTKTAATVPLFYEAASDLTVTLPAIPAGASYGTPSYSENTSNLLTGSPSISGNVLTYGVTAQGKNTTATITVPVTGATNYNDYSVTVTVTTVGYSQDWADSVFGNNNADYTNTGTEDDPHHQIILNNDVTLPKTVTINEDMTIDLKGNDITAPAGQDAFAVSDGVDIIVTDTGTAGTKGTVTGGAGTGGGNGESAITGGNITISGGVSVIGGAGAGSPAGTGGKGGTAIETSGSVTVGSGSTVAGGTGTTGGNGITVTGSGAVTNNGTVIGGNGTTADGGDAISTTTGTNTNNGQAIGGNGGNGGSNAGSGGSSQSSTTGNIIVGDHAVSAGGVGGTATSGSGGNGGAGVNSTSGGNITINGNSAAGGTGAAVIGGNGGTGTTSNGTGGTGAKTTGSGIITVDIGAMVTGGTGGSNPASGSNTAGSTGGTGTQTESGAITINGAVAGGAGGNGGAAAGNGGAGGTGAVTTTGNISGTGSVTGGNGGNIPQGSSGTAGAGGQATSGSGTVTVTTQTQGKGGLNANAKVEVEAGSPVDKVEAPKETLIDGAVSQEEREEAAKQGANVSVDVTLKVTAADKPAEQAKINAQAVQSQEKVAVSLFLDITLTKTVTGGSQTGQVSTVITRTENNILIPITLNLPPEHQGKTGYKAFRAHGVNVDVLTAAPNENREYLVVSPDKTKITLYVNRFSTYAIGYDSTSRPDPAPTPSTSGGTYSPSVVIGGNGGQAGGTAQYDPYKGTLTITPAKGYEVEDVTVNGLSKGPATQLTGIYGTDTVKITFKKAESDPQRDKLQAQLSTIKITTFSKKSRLNGKPAIKVTWKVTGNIKFKGFVVYRSLKKSKGYESKPFFTASRCSYVNNKQLKSGKTYYYKVKGFVVLNGEKLYSPWSTKTWKKL